MRTNITAPCGVRRAGRRRRSVRSGGAAGYTLVEFLVAASAFALVATGIITIMVTSGRAVDAARAETYAAQDAGLAMQMIVQDVREAARFEVLDGGDRLRIVKPRENAQGVYNRFEPDTSRPVLYYLSANADGQGFRTLMREQSGQVRSIRKGVQNVRNAQNQAEPLFEVGSDSTVKVEIAVAAKPGRATRVINMVQRVVYMRNK